MWSAKIFWLAIWPNRQINGEMSSYFQKDCNQHLQTLKLALLLVCFLPQSPKWGLSKEFKFGTDFWNKHRHLKKITKEHLKIDEMDFKNYRERPSSAEPWLYRPTNSPGKCWHMYPFIHSVSVQCLLCADTILNTGDSETDFHRPPPTPTTHRHKYIYTHTPVPIEFIFKSGETDNEWNITFSSSDVCCGER